MLQPGLPSGSLHCILALFMRSPLFVSLSMAGVRALCCFIYTLSPATGKGGQSSMEAG